MEESKFSMAPAENPQDVIFGKDEPELICNNKIL